MKTIFYILILLFNSLLLSGCNNKPNDSEIQLALETASNIHKYSGIFDIKNAKQTNGYLLDEFYYAEISYQRYCLVDIDTAVDIIAKQPNTEQPATIMDNLMQGMYELAADLGMLKLSLANKFGEFSKGDIINESQTLKFIHTENGWRLYNKKR